MHSHKEQKISQKVRDKVDKSTAVMALDPRTRLMLYKLVNAGAITEVHGTISTGKESVVVYAKGENNLEFLSHGNLSVSPGKFRLRVEH